MSRHYNGFIFEDKKTGSDYLIVIQVEGGRYIGIHAAYPKDGLYPYYSNARFIEFPKDIQDLMASIEVKKSDFFRLFLASEKFSRSLAYPQHSSGLEAAVMAQFGPKDSSVAVKAAPTEIEYHFYHACDTLFSQFLLDLRGLALSQQNPK